MTTYKSYAEAKIANPDCEIVTTGKNWIYDKELIGTFQPRVTEGCSHAINDYSWVICNPADYCSTIKEFFDAKLTLDIGDIILSKSGKAHVVNSWISFVDCKKEDGYILSAAALNGGCNIPDKAEQWTIYNNTLPLSELSDEQAAMLFNAWRAGGNMQILNDEEEWKDYNSGFYPLDVYRIKPKSERELFIIAAINHGIKPETISIAQIFGELFDSGKFKMIKDGE